ncbi:hypothetical protein K1719_021503 [Acacia pycnantha]|nr:hypothetical protein K1719_021503 [Acacia pycnantha]
MEVTQISTPLVWKEANVERILVGKVLSSKMYTRAAMELILQKAWNLQSGFSVIEITGNEFLFKFSSIEEYYRILRGRPWSINGSVLNLLECSKYNSCEELDYSHCPMWIQMHNVPMEARFLKNVVTIGGYVGEVVLAEDPCSNEYVIRKKEEALLRRKDVHKQRDNMASVFNEDELFCIKVNKSSTNVKGPDVTTDERQKDWKRDANVVDTKVMRAFLSLALGSTIKNN